MKKKDNSTKTRSGFRGRRDLMLYNTDKLILKTNCNPENEIKCPDNSDNFSNINDYMLKLFFFCFCSAYYFRIPKIIFVGACRYHFDQISANPFRANH